MWPRAGAGLIVVMVCSVLAAPAQAALPGRPGRIAYDILAEDGVYTVRPDGTGERRILPGAAEFQWSPDGRRLAYSTEDGTGSELFVARGTGRGVRRVLTAARVGPDVDALMQPSWSPTGRELVLEATTWGDEYGDGLAQLDRPRVVVAPIDGGPPRDLHAGMDPTWSPSGRHIAYVTDNRDGRGHRVAIMRADGTRSRILVRDPRFKWALDFSPDGRRLSWLQDGVVHVVAVRTGRVTVIPPDPSFRIEHVTWRPSGNRLAYLRQAVVAAGRRSPPHEIHTMRPDGTGDRLVLKLPLDPDEGRWATHLAWQPLPAARRAGRPRRAPARRPR